MSFNEEIEKAFSSAYHSERGGNAEWQTVMTSYGAQPLSDNEREALLNSEMKITRGAFPIELRRVYEIIMNKYPQEASGFNMDAKVLEYYQKIKPFSGLGDIFQNAATGTAKYSQGLQAAKHKTMTCKNCGAPRLEEMQYDDCLFCGSKLFEVKEN
ncbi:MAG: hypothetical protein KDC73_06935 [Ignavibacteriae bacterium]|nr:hypothetical protein [Ignavibacteriota bacterium]MCB9244638.1 hypothetical protein [Ignavibacteriales bacterium]